MNHPIWLLVWVIALESIIITVLLPGNWTASVIEQESELLEIRLGPEESRWVHEKARSWYNSSLIETGVYSAAYNHLMPSIEERRKSVGMKDMGSNWFEWVGGRLQSTANAYYHILSRFALLLPWAPYFIILLAPAIYDGIASWKIKRTNFAYTSPLLHQYSTNSIIYVLIGLVALFLAPIVLDPTIIPASIMVICVMAGLMIGNLQKRV